MLTYTSEKQISDRIYSKNAANSSDGAQNCSVLLPATCLNDSKMGRVKKCLPRQGLRVRGSFPARK